MSPVTPDSLWDRLCQALADKGMLPPGNPTPAEIGRHADRLRGDGDVSRFVNDYYYPMRFGGSAGAMSDADAEALVTALGRKKPAAARPSDAARPAGQASTLQELVDQAEPGDEITIPRGVYREPLRIDKFVVLAGAGVLGDVVLDVDGTTALTIAAMATVRRLLIRTRGALTDPAAALRIVRGRATIEDCAVEPGERFDGIWVEAGADPTIQRTRIGQSGRHGLWVAHTAGGTFDDCRVAGSAGTGAVIAGHARFHACEFVKAGGPGLTVEQGAASFEYCHIHDNADCGVYASQSANPTFRHCRIHNNRSAGVLLFEDSVSVFDTCEIRENARAGIEVSDGATVKISACRVRGSGYNGLLFHAGTHSVLEDSVVHDNAASGAEVREGADVSISRTNLSGNSKHGLVVRRGGVCRIERSSAGGNGDRDVLFEDELPA